MADYQILFYSQTEMCLLSNDVTEYHFVSQGKTTIPNVDDGEELLVTDVSVGHWFTSGLRLCKLGIHDGWP